MTGETFHAIYGDLFTELFNKETKGSAGLFFFCGLSTDIDAVNYGQNTIHIHTLLRNELHKSLHMKTGFKHKELTLQVIHVEHVKIFEQKIVCI